MEDGGCEPRVYLRKGFEQCYKVIYAACAARRNDWDSDSLADSIQHLQIEAALHAVCVDRINDNLAGTFAGAAPDPFDGFHAGVFPSALGEDPESTVHPLHVHTQYDALVAVKLRRFPDQGGIPDRAGIHGNLIRPALQHPVKVIRCVDTAANGQRNKNRPRRFRQDVGEQRPAFGGCGDIIKHQLVRSVVAVVLRQFHRRCHISQFLEINPFDDPSVLHVQAGNDSLGNHLAVSIAFFRLMSPV